MIRPACSSDLEAILEIYNEAIINTTASYDYRPHTLADRVAWYEQKVADGYPVVVFELGQSVAGFATFGPFRIWPAYKYTVEHSVYVHQAHRRKGIGAELLQEIIRIADEREYATLIAGIDAGNEASIRMHEQVGFKKSGTILRAGYKFGRWLDLSFYQYDLRGPASPREE